MPKTIHLIVIDPQRSFCAVVDPAKQQACHDGELCVPNAWDDMVRVSQLVTRLGEKIDDISVTQDSHHLLHIAHPTWFKNRKTGQAPNPFTIMSESGNVITGSDGVEYQVFNPAYHDWTINYLRALSAGNRYPHCIWPPHCLIGSVGYTVVEPLFEALFQWEREYSALVNYVAKGSNYKVEHFSAVRAEVPDPDDNGTQLNSDFIGEVMKADIILLAGEARSHCLANTVRDMANSFADDSFIAKCVLLTDGTSDVPGFEKYGQDFVTEMTKRGMQVATTADFLN